MTTAGLGGGRLWLPSAPSGTPTAGPAPGRLASAGFFGGYAFDGRTWHDFDPDSDQTLDIEAPRLSVDIYDSDFATVRYEPPGPGSGTACLGNTPRTYSDDESASAPADVPREA